MRRASSRLHADRTAGGGGAHRHRQRAWPAWRCATRRRTRLEQEAARLAALLEAARAEARASGLAARWEPQCRAGRTPGFRFVGLPASAELPSRWLGEGVTAEVVGARAVVLGPEPLIGAQRIVLRLDDQRLTLATDGLGPFAVVADERTGRTVTPPRPARAASR